MLAQKLSRPQSVPAAKGRVVGHLVRPRRAVQAQLFRRDSPAILEDVGLEDVNQPTKRQREQIKRTLQELGFTEQAADILAYGKITNSNADLLIGDIRASFGIYQPPQPQGPVESVQSGVQDLLSRLRLPFLGLILATGLAAAAFSQRELLGSLIPSIDDIADSIAFAVDDALDALSRLPGLDGAALAGFQDAVDEFLFQTLQR